MWPTVQAIGLGRSQTIYESGWSSSDNHYLACTLTHDKVEGIASTRADGVFMAIFTEPVESVSNGFAESRGYCTVKFWQLSST